MECAGTLIQSGLEVVAEEPVRLVKSAVVEVVVSHHLSVDAVTDGHQSLTTW